MGRTSKNSWQSARRKTSSVWKPPHEFFDPGEVNAACTNSPDAGAARISPVLCTPSSSGEEPIFNIFCTVHFILVVPFRHFSRMQDNCKYLHDTCLLVFQL